jgi:hypothetical protein
MDGTPADTGEATAVPEGEQLEVDPGGPEVAPDHYGRSPLLVEQTLEDAAIEAAALGGEGWLT